MARRYPAYARTRAEAGQFAADCSAIAERFGLKAEVVERVAWPW